MYKTLKETKILFKLINY